MQNQQISPLPSCLSHDGEGSQTQTCMQRSDSQSSQAADQITVGRLQVGFEPFCLQQACPGVMVMVAAQISFAFRRRRYRQGPPGCIDMIAFNCLTHRETGPVQASGRPPLLVVLLALLRASFCFYKGVSHQ